MFKTERLKSEPATLNFNGTTFSLNTGKIKDIKSTEHQAIACIFDTNGDNILDKGEIAFAKENFSDGVFNVCFKSKTTDVNFTVTDYNNRTKYFSSWIIDDKSRIIDRVEDIDGDGIRDYHMNNVYSGKRKISSTEYRKEKDANGVIWETMEYFDSKNGKTIYTREIINGKVYSRSIEKQNTKGDMVGTEYVTYPYNPEDIFDYSISTYYDDYENSIKAWECAFDQKIVE